MMGLGRVSLQLRIQLREYHREDLLSLSILFLKNGGRKFHGVIPEVQDRPGRTKQLRAPKLLSHSTCTEKSGAADLAGSAETLPAPERIKASGSREKTGIKQPEK
jgi:hypothetical protein